MGNSKPIICLDFDGVIHSYVSGWQGASVIPDDPVPGAMRFIIDALERFGVAIYSSRSGQKNGISAMQDWLFTCLVEECRRTEDDPYNAAQDILDQIMWPTEKPPALVTLDDRALTFTGTWPSLDDLAAFKPWNKG